MKAIRIHSYGHSDQLKLEEAEQPQLQKNQVLVKVFDAGVNPVDWKIREGHLKAARPQQFPFTLGQDFAGEIVDLSPEVTRFQKGDRVYGTTHGAYAEFVAVDESKIAKIPDSVDFATAASIPTAGLTAYQMVNLVSLSPGSTVLIHGAAGGVGSFAVQLAAFRGARVLATATADDFDYLKQLGVEQVIDFHKENFEDKFKNVDAVIDLIGGETLKRSLNILKPGGILVSSVGPVDPKLAEAKKVRAIQFMMKPNSEDLFEMAKLIESGTLKVHIKQVFPLEEAQKAQDTLEKGHAQGKYVLEVSRSLAH